MQVRTVEKSCQTKRFLSVLERTAGKGSCFTGCLNITAPCYIRCMYDIVLGLGSGQHMPSNGDTGLSMATISSMWQNALDGCPHVGLAAATDGRGSNGTRRVGTTLS